MPETKKKEDPVDKLISKFRKQCESHRLIKVLNGAISGGRSYRQARKSHLWIVLDACCLEDFVTIWDTQDEIRAKIDHQRIIYMPIEDRKTPKSNESLDKVLKVMYTYLKAGKRVHVSCIGGHGRTGMVIGCFLGKYCKEISNPVEYIRKNYCDKAVETYFQHALVNKYAGLPLPDYREYIKPVIEPVVHRLDPDEYVEGYGFVGYGYDYWARESLRRDCAGLPEKGGEKEIGFTNFPY